MSLARFTVGEHDSSCSGCPACRADYAAHLGESAAATFQRLTEHTRTMMRAAAGATLRISQPRPEVRKSAAEWRDDFGQRLQGFGSIQPDPPPNPYGEVTKQTPSPYDDKYYSPRGQPPDSYLIALVKKENTHDRHNND
jgi:hypothetical protein